MKKAIVTNYNNKILYMLLSDNKEIEIELYDAEKPSILSNIYIGRVRDIVKNIGAAFIEIAPDTVCYFSLTEENVLFLNGKNTDKVCEGDLILVQVSKEAIKTKAPVVTCNINLSGKFLVLTLENKGVVGVSKKISDKNRIEELKNLILPVAGDKYGFIVRTGAAEATDTDILAEANQLISEFEDMLKIARTRVKYTVIKKSENQLIKDLRKIVEDADFEEVVTDDADLFNKLSCFENVRLYSDEEISLNRTYNIEKKIHDATSKNVWIKNGAYLVIEPTEALTVIDVNTGKFDGNLKDRENTFLKINIEAAKEIVRQIKLRNLSGIIIIDFINMKNKENVKTLLKELELLVYKDTILTKVVDCTKLGLVELTRQKVKKPLHELIKNS